MDSEPYNPSKHNHKQLDELWTQSRYKSENRKVLKSLGRFYGKENHHKGFWKHLDRPKPKKAFRVPRLLPNGSIIKPI